MGANNDTILRHAKQDHYRAEAIDLMENMRNVRKLREKEGNPGVIVALDQAIKNIEKAANALVRAGNRG